MQSLKADMSLSSKVTCEDVADYNDEAEDAIVIATSKVKDLFKGQNKFPNLFLKTISIQVPLLKEVNQHVNAF